MKRLTIFFVILIMFPASVSAHVHLRDTSPKKGAVLTAPPSTVKITFSNSVEPVFSRLTVIDSSGKTVSGKTEFFKDNSVMESGLTKNLALGTYTVKWKCVSTDGHREAGSYTFTIK